MSMFLFISSFIGCGSQIAEDEFATAYSEEMCARIFSCVAEEDQATLEEIYGSQEACAAGMQAELEANLSSDALVYDPKQGSECISYLQSAECSESDPETDPCSNVYTLAQE